MRQCNNCNLGGERERYGVFAHMRVMYSTLGSFCAARDFKVVSASSTVTETVRRLPLQTLWPYELSRLLVMIQQGRKKLLLQKPDCAKKTSGNVN